MTTVLLERKQRSLHGVTASFASAPGAVERAGIQKAFAAHNRANPDVVMYLGIG